MPTMTVIIMFNIIFMYRMKEQDDDFNKQRLEYEREIKHLRLLLRERQEMIDSALGDKR